MIRARKNKTGIAQNIPLSFFRSYNAVNLKEQRQRRVEGIINKKELVEGMRRITETKELIKGEDFYNYGVTIKELHLMIKENGLVKEVR